MSATDSRFRDFDAAIAERQAKGDKAKGLTFKLGGETFDLPPLSAAGLLRLVRMLGSEGADAMMAFQRFLNDALPADAERFDAALERSGMELDELLDLISWIVENSTGRPTEPPSVLPTSPSGNGQPSKVVNIGAPAPPSST